MVILSQGFAERWFAGDPDVIGRTMTLDGGQVAIVGIVPEDFRFHLPGSPMTGLPAKGHRPLPAHDGLVRPQWTHAAAQCGWQAEARRQRSNRHRQRSK